MNSGTELQPIPPAPLEMTAVLRQIADATDMAMLAGVLDEVAARLLPATRVDIFTGVDQSERLVLTCGEQNGASPPPIRGLPVFLAWLQRSGYDATATVPLTVAGRHQGRLVLARRRAGIPRDTLEIAEQIAPAIGLRLFSDRLLAELAERDDRLKTAEQRLRDVEEVRLRATLAAGAAHDVGNLFASVLGHAQLLQQEAPPALQGDLKTIEQAARDGHHLLRRMLSTRTTTAPSGVTASLALLPTLVHDALRLTQPFWELRRSVTVKIALAPVPPVRGHPAELREVLVNLILNGVTAMPEGGTLTVRTYSAGERAIVEISDTGNGIAPAHQGAIFQPLVTSRESGIGLGLSVSRALIESYGGTLSVTSTPGHGATFSVSLPVARGADMVPEPPPVLRCAAP